MKIEITLDQLESLLQEQKRIVGEYITRNLSTFTFFNDNTDGTTVKKPIDTNLTKGELQKECYKAPFPNDLLILKKYSKNDKDE